MTRRELASKSMLWVSIVTLICHGRLASAEIMVGLGDLEKPTLVASARINKALSAFHLMMAALDRRQVDEAKKQQGETIKWLDDATNAYVDALSVAQNRPLDPKPRTDEERTYVSYFWENAGAYGFEFPGSPKSLIKLATAVMGEFEVQLRKLDVGALEQDPRARLKLFESAVAMQEFLTSATVVLRIG